MWSESFRLRGSLSAIIAARRTFLLRVNVAQMSKKALEIKHQAVIATCNLTPGATCEVIYFAQRHKVAMKIFNWPDRT